MNLNSVQHRRFVSGIGDLKKLVELAAKVVPGLTNPEKFSKVVIDTLKKGKFDEYQSFELNKVDLTLKLKVMKIGRIVGFVELDGKKAVNEKIHNKLNHFIYGSVLQDPDVEYYFV